MINIYEVICFTGIGYFYGKYTEKCNKFLKDVWNGLIK